MTEPTTVEDAVELVALGMVSETAEGNRSQKNMPIKDLIEADRYLKGKTAAGKAHFGLRMTKCIPPGGG
jgi:hypothetical protein